MSNRLCVLDSASIGNWGVTYGEDVKIASVPTRRPSSGNVQFNMSWLSASA